MKKSWVNPLNLLFLAALAAIIYAACFLVPGLIEARRQNSKPVEPSPRNMKSIVTQRHNSELPVTGRQEEINKIQADIDKYVSGPFDKLEAACREMLKLTPEDCSRWAQLGQALHFQGRDKEAIDSIEKAIKLDKSGNNPIVWECRIHLARSYLRLGNKKKGEEVLLQIKNHLPEFEEGDRAAVFGMLLDIQKNYDVKKIVKESQ